MTSTVTRYASVLDLSQRLPWSDLAEAAAKDNPAVDGDLLMRRVTTEGVLDMVTEEDQAAAAAAMTRLETVLDDASGEIDGYIAGRYGEISPVPEVLAVRCVDIAVYRLLGGDAQSERYLLYKRAVDWLTAVADGKINLVTDSTDDSTPAADIFINAPDRVFTEDSLGEYERGYGY